MEERVASYSVPKENQNVFAITRFHSNNSAAESQQNLVEINSRASLFKKRHFYRTIAIILIVLVILLLIGVIILACYYASSAKKLSKVRKICTSEECLRSASNLRLSMDTNIDPCDDFYKFTCGKWSDEHINHGWYAKFSNFESIDERISIASLNFFESNNSKTDPVPVRQSRDFYKSCMGVGSINKWGYTVLVKYLKEVNLPQVPTIFTMENTSKFHFDWIKAEVNIKKIFSMDVFVQLVIDADIYNRSKNVIYLGSSRSSSPLPSPFKVKQSQSYTRTRRSSKSRQPNEANDESEGRYERANKNIIKEVIRVMVSNVTDAPDTLQLQTAADIIWNMTTEISELAGSDEDEDDVDDQLDVRKIKVSELQNLTDQMFVSNNETPVEIWETYLTLLYTGIENVKLDLDGSDYIYYLPDEFNYLTNIVFYLMKTPDVHIELYTWWIAVNAMILNTTSEIVNYIAKQLKPFYINSVIRSRSLECAELVINFMGMAVSYGIADKTFMNYTKPKVDQMLNDIKAAFVERVNDIEWMDAKTKKATLEKSKEMISFIGFPDWLLNKSAIELYYSNVTIRNDTYLENMISLIKRYTPLRLAAIRQNNERTWRTDPTTVNAYNVFGDNSINVPMAILSFPIYQLGLEVLNYGAIGTVLGHELTHGFDNTGRKFDKYGNYIQWWSNDTIETFEKKTECFIAQYDNYTIPGVDANINGRYTLGENLADNGGLHHAHLAYKRFIKQYGQEDHLPGFEHFTDDQLFFIAFGSVWCETRSPEAILYQIKSDPHSPNSVRVLGTLQNSHEFSEAFKCPIGSGMNPNRTRCRIW